MAHPEAAGLDRRVWVRDERKQGNQPQAPPLHVTAFIATGCPDIQVPTDGIRSHPRTSSYSEPAASQQPLWQKSINHWSSYYNYTPLGTGPGLTLEKKAEVSKLPRRTETKCCNRGWCYLQSARCECAQLPCQLFISRPRADGDRLGALRFSFTLWLVQYCSNVASNSSSRHCGLGSLPKRASNIVRYYAAPREGACPQLVRLGLQMCRSVHLPFAVADSILNGAH
ncbi:hypothetical protein T01_3491 [Trichinella spiralis]|uniref:Uncharacterized protein n=1 Tax=Trichinella spiralis TaxID=6334 RepID=A0A0V1BNE7_TRISP|nr:hypothetical protein T01_3491 [Trichinella spiralis]